MTCEITLEDTEIINFGIWKNFTSTNTTWKGRLLTTDVINQELEDKISSLLFEAATPHEASKFASLFAQMGASSDQLELIDRDIACILASDQATQTGRLCKSLENRTKENKLKTFWKKHKKEIIIGAIIVTVVVITVVVIAATAGTGAAAAAAGTSLAGGGAAADKLNNDNEKPQASFKDPSKTTSQDNPIVRAADEGYVIRQEQIRKAEQIAKEQRYPNLVYSQEHIDRATMQVNNQVDEFWLQLPNNFDQQDALKLLAIANNVKTAKDATTNGNLTGAFFTSCEISNELINFSKQKMDTFNELSQPIQMAEAELQKMQRMNNEASLERCQREGYEPNLEFHPETPQMDIYRSIIIDKNNPNPNAQILIEGL